MNYSLSREIYGNIPWMVDRPTFSALFNLLTDIRNGVTLDNSAERMNNYFLHDIKSGTRVITNTGQLGTESQDELIYVINLNGPIIKNGGLSTYGMDELVTMMATYQADERVIGGVIKTDSGGGSQLGMELMQHAIRTRSKPIVAFIPRSGVSASAAYGIDSETDWIVSESEDNEVGSIGTMISFKAQPNKSIGADGAKQVTIYASASTKKNLWFEEALNNDNYELAISEVLDPVNTRFTGGVKTVRKNVKDTQLDGSVYRAGDVLGSLVDEIGPIERAFAKVQELHSAQKIKNNKNKTAMTKAELKAQFPDTYNEILGIGVAAGADAERDRVGTWLAHLTTDPEAVKAGIESKAEITATARENFLVKAASKGKLDTLKGESPKDLVVEESKNEVVSDANAFYSGIMSKLIKKA